MIKKCLVCGKEFITYPCKIKVGKGKFCSNQCYYKNLIGKPSRIKGRKFPQTTGKNHPNWKGGKPKCIDCGKRLSFHYHSRCRKCQGKYKTGENHSGWKGGKIKDSNGYILIYKPEHLSCMNRKYVLEHRFVAEKCLGRYLTGLEVIHHINGIKDDNRPENLYLFTDYEHKSFERLKNKHLLISNLL